MHPDQVTVTCDRCGAQIEGIRTESAAAGFYDVTEGKGWATFGNRGEKNVCDPCMFADPRYVAVYGERK